MLKKAKLYTLLVIMVASTAVGLFGTTGDVYADNEGLSCEVATPPAENQNHADETIYCGGTAYTKLSDSSFLCQGVNTVYGGGCDESGAGAAYFQSDEVVYVGTEATDTRHIYVLYFPNGTNLNTTTTKIDGVWLQFDNQFVTGKYAGNNPGVPKDIVFDPGASIDPEVIDETEANPDVVEGINPENLEDSEDPIAASCQIKGVGWLICPLFLFLAEVTDEAYKALDNTFLKLEPIALPGSSASDDRLQLYDSWKAMRDIANIIFIIGFLIIVFSQLTSFGVSNYGVKRLLPKIIIAAILVNISFFICAIAVDISNIIGNSMRGLLMPEGGASLQFDFTYEDDSGALKEFAATGFQGMAGWILGGAIAAGLVYVFLPVFLPMVFAAAMAVLTVVIALTIRQALVVILIVISPLAFVALLLPNTESLFQKWRSLLTTMLLIYPIISVIFGASALASRILMGTDDFPTQMVGAGVAVIPLALTPIIMKVSGGLLNRWVGIVNDVDKGIVDAGRKGVERQAERLDNRRRITSLRGAGGRWLGGRYRRGAKSEAIDAGLKAEAGRGSQQYVAQEIQSDNRFASRVAGGGIIDKADPGAVERAVASATFTVQKAELEEVKAAGVTVESMNFSELREYLNEASSSAQKAAALDRMVTIGSPSDYEEYVDHYGSRSDASESIIRSTLAESLSKNNPLLKAADIDNIRNGQMGKQIYDANGNTVDSDGNPLGKNASTLAETVKNNVGANVVSQAKMATMSSADLKYAFDSTSGDPAARDKLIETANSLLNNDQLKGNIQHNEKQIREIAGASRSVQNNQSQSPQQATGKTAGVDTSGWIETSPGGFIYNPKSTPRAGAAPMSANQASAAGGPTTTSASPQTPSASTPSSTYAPEFAGGITPEDLSRTTKDMADRLANRLSRLKVAGSSEYDSEISSLREAIQNLANSKDKNARDDFLSEAGAQLLNSTSLGGSASNIAIDIAEELNLLASARGEPRQEGPPIPPGQNKPPSGGRN